MRAAIYLVIAVGCGLAVYACTDNARVTAGRVFSSGPNSDVSGAINSSEGGSGGVRAPGGSGANQEICGGYTYKGEAGSLDILVLYDDSASTALQTFAWEPLRAAMNTFITSPQSEGIGMGLRWFSDHGCSAEVFANPDVPIDTLPDNADTLRNAINMHGPWGGWATQTKYAIEGATRYMRHWAKYHQDGRNIIMLVTDGLPGPGFNDEGDEGNCEVNSDIDNTAQAAADAYRGNPKIPVYVLGAGPSLENLNAIAAKGGTEQAFIIVDPTQGTQLILDALNAIRTKALPCDYALPQEYFLYNDPTLVNLAHNNKPVGYVTSKPLCDPQKGGWYYDNPTAPNRIWTCEQTCKHFAQGGRVEIYLGCPIVALII